MTNLQAAIASGQVSAAQIEAHHVAGELPIEMLCREPALKPRFQRTYCSQCLKDCGPGMDGVAGCADHIADASKMVPKTLREAIDSASGNDALIMCRAGDVRAALDDAERLGWLEKHVFVHKWNGVIDSGSRTSWSVAGDYRHKTHHMNGTKFRDAIDAAIKATS